MGIPELQQLASSMGLKEFEHVSSKAAIVRAIQRQRGEEPCFTSDQRYTCAKHCEWRPDCIKLRAVWLR